MRHYAPELDYVARGHVRVMTRRLEKRYHAVLGVHRLNRWSRRGFHTAAQADEYGRRVVARLQRMADMALLAMAQEA